jgi:hypothetical protein
MHAQVLLVICTKGEFFTAIITSIWFFPSMDTRMFQQPTFKRENLSAHFTFVNFSAVRIHMHLELVVVRETFAAEFTLVWNILQV